MTASIDGSSDPASMAGELTLSRTADRRVQYIAAAEQVLPEEARPVRCQLGGSAGCDLAVDLKVADSWGDSAWGCWEHAEDALRQVPSVFLAEPSAHGLRHYRARHTSGS